MTSEDTGHASAADLRRRAEVRVPAIPVASGQGSEHVSSEDAAAILHELQVHQIELELQNDELRRTQAELDASRSRYFDLFDLAPVGYCMLSTDGLILEANQTISTLVGLPRAALLGQPVTRFIFAEDQDHYHLTRRQGEKDSGPCECELRMVSPGGAPFWVHLIVAADRSGASTDQRIGEAPSLHRMTVSDISERKRAEEESARMGAQLQQAQKLQTLGVLAGGVAHDFNNLLAAIVGHADLGMMAAGRDSKVVDHFESIEKSAMKAALLTSQLLAYAGKGKYLLATVDLDTIVKEVTRLVSDILPQGVVLHCDLVDRLPYVNGDPSQISQILTNLLTNACEAIADGSEGIIAIRTCAERIDLADIESGAWELPLNPGHYATVEVEDTGKGMTPEILASAFDPFFSTKFTGRGLGLSAVIGVLGSHGGNIRVRSTPGRGSSFKVILPAMQGERLTAAYECPPARPEEGWLLLVDDEKAVRAVARKMSERMGFSVIEADGGTEALALFRYHHDDLALVLLDSSMPRMSGWEVYREMRKIDRRVPVILSSGYDAQPIDMSLDGLAGFLKKPYRTAEFQKLMRKAMALRPVRSSSHDPGSPVKT